ncbi:MAG: hypothetical protein COA54_02505 [Thiotrichaceae bacterium]|nr:MAG: hypothetical protein COA54_02505 [Thiotrichaceae bacterium]
MGISSLQLDTKQAKLYAKFLRKAPEITREETKQELTTILLFLEREIKEDTPVGVGGSAGLRGSISHDLRGTTQDTLRGRVFSPLAHAQAVEYGTKPHLPPFTALMDWVEAKLGITDPDEVIGVSIAIALKIKHHGTKGAHMFENNFSKHQQRVTRQLGGSIDRAVARWQAGER